MIGLALQLPLMLTLSDVSTSVSELVHYKCDCILYWPNLVFALLSVLEIMIPADMQISFDAFVIGLSEMQ